MNENDNENENIDEVFDLLTTTLTTLNNLFFVNSNSQQLDSNFEKINFF